MTWYWLLLLPFYLAVIWYVGAMMRESGAGIVREVVHFRWWLVTFGAGAAVGLLVRL